MTTKVKFKLPATHYFGSNECVLLGEFNNWNLEEGYYLTMQADGSMTVEVELEAGKQYEYRYLLGNGHWVNDDREKIQTEVNGFVMENCVVKVPSISSNPKPKTAPKAKVAKKKIVAKETTVVKEDLTKIEGVGKKIEELLYKNKITSYKLLSKATVKSLKAILDTAGSKFAMHNPGTWPKQAKLAADAKWDDLAILQQQLKGGK